MHRFVSERSDEHVILLDRSGQPSGTHPKRSVHGPNTPLHLGFSCHLTDGRGRVLLTQRAASKATWPDTWTNACCGHPLPGETLRAAVLRRLQHELGVSADGIGLAIADFTYRSEMPNGTVEHEVCPVVVAHVEGEPNLNPDEVTAARWVEWDTLRTRAEQRPHSLSPWSVGQIAELDQLSPSPRVWLADFPSVGLDTPLGTPGVAVHPCSPSESFDPAHRPVEEILGAYLDERTSELAAIDPNLVAVAEEVAGLIAAGGKRLRPAFVYWGHRATGAGHDASVYYVAAAVEMLHTFALLHDDVMDRAATRRGRPTAQRSFAEVHRADGLAGDATWFGTSAAILAGDLAFVWADDLLERAGLTATALSRVRGVFTTLRTEVMAGQYLDLRLDGLAGADVASARRVALLKSGRYTVTRPLALGQTIACDHDTDTADALRVYGDALGLAFQMRDDVLGLLGDPAVTGKSSMSDLREGKRTVLALRALALATTSERAVLERALGNPELDDTDAERCREIITSSGALASVETLIRTQHAAAVEAVAGLPQPARTALRSLASTVVRRAM
jgi:isopentenyl-diphosphate delta-isomerase type 1